MLIRFDQVSKSFDSKPLLKQVCFQLNFSEKVGLIGKNGCGKTTFLRLINGELEPDDGQIVKHPHLRIGFLQQIVRFDSEKNLFDEAVSVFRALEELGQEMERLEGEIETQAKESGLQSLLDQYAELQTRWEMEGGYSYRSQTESVLFGLGFDQNGLGKRVAELSGGELNRLNLAKLLLSKPNLLLLDEPTNHLDIAAVEWLESYLRDYPHGFILISHDRYFLDTAVAKVFELSQGRLDEYSGNYSQAIKERENRLLLYQKSYEQQQELIDRTEDFIRRNIAGQKTKQAQSRRKMLQKLERLEAIPGDRSRAKFGFEMTHPSGSLVLKISDLDIGYQGATLIRKMNLNVFRGERIGIVGPNGSGKTTLLKTILGSQEPVRGRITVGQNVRIGYYAQTLSDLNASLTVMEEMRSVASLDSDETLRGYLARFLFRGDEVFQSVSLLSGGEKSRLALAKLIFSKANTLMLDEPTNHLDIPSCEALESALQAFPGTLILVSHDRYLVNSLAERIIHLDGTGKYYYFEGTYREFEAQSAKRTTGKEDRPSSRQADRIAAVGEASANERLSKNERNKIRSRCDTLEQEIRRLEEEIRLALEKLGEPATAGNHLLFRQLNDHYQAMTTRLDRLYLEWGDSLALLEK
jgi:ATP-binding cassette subfamily F protein 3